MKITIMLRLIVVFVAFFSVVFVLNNNKPTHTLSDRGFGWKFPVAKFPKTGPDRTIAYSDIRDPGGVPEGLPVRLKIPVIGVDSAIEDAYITSDGRMDVPSGTVNVAWFALGPFPGREGSAVIGGHYGRYQENKGPTVFFNLDKLQVGDQVYIEDDKGDTLAFRVREIKLFDRNADATTVFTSEDGRAHLNLITCEGVWNQVNDSYPDRRVVFTDAIPAEGGVVVNKLPFVGAKPTIATTIVPTEMPSVIPTVVPTNGFTQSAKSLYATPADGLITSTLLISIVFVAVKIFRR